MSDSHQKRFLQTVRRALGKPLTGAPGPNLFQDRPPDLDDRLAEYRSRTPQRQQALLEELKTRADAVNMHLSVVDDVSAAQSVICDLALESTPEWGSEKRIVAWDHPLLHQLQLVDALAAQQVPLTTTRLSAEKDTLEERDRLRSDIAAAYIGITSADFVVAHTATLVMKSRPHQLRSVSLLPSIHVCVVTGDQIVADLEELYTRLLWDPAQRDEGLTNCMTFISAPSKTGDIELVMVNGAHGPKEVHLIVIAR